MNYLQLFQETARKCGVAVPTTTVSQTDENLRLLGFVDQAWLEIQGAHNNWDFMWARGEFSLTADTKDYDAAALDLNYVNYDSMTLYDASEADEVRLTFVPYMQYRKRYDLGTVTAKKPTCFTVLPNRDLRFHPTPDDTYTVQFDYYKRPTSLSGDADEPEIPTVAEHWAIVWCATRLYAEYQEAVDLIQIASAEYLSHMARLRREELPFVNVSASPLA